MSTEAKVGAFVIASILALGMSVYSVTQTQNVKGQVVFKTYFRNAGGLAPGASVLFGGIQVGQVDDVRSFTRGSDAHPGHIQCQTPHTPERKLEGTQWNGFRDGDARAPHHDGKPTTRDS